MRLGIFGGTFDPPHIGHQILAAEMLYQLGLDKVLWCVTADPPHKQDQVITPIEIRLALVDAAVKDNPGFEVSRIEIDRPGPHFAVDTVLILQRQFPGAEIIYMIGGDSLNDLPTWHTPQKLIQAVAAFGVMRRHGADINLDTLEIALPGLSQKVQFIDTPQIEISSSQIRERAAAGEPYRYFLPDEVSRLVDRFRLYQPGSLRIEGQGRSS